MNTISRTSMKYIRINNWNNIILKNNHSHHYNNNNKKNLLVSSTFRLYHSSLFTQHGDRNKKEDTTTTTTTATTTSMKSSLSTYFIQPYYYNTCSIGMNHINCIRHFSTGHPTTNNNNNSNNSSNSINNSIHNQESFTTISSSTTSPSNTNTEDHQDDNPLTRKEKIQKAAMKSQKAVSKGAHSLKDLVVKHGFSFVGTYFTIWITTLSSIFIALDSGLVDPMTLMNIDLPWHSGVEANEIDVAETDEDIHSAIDYISMKMKEYKWTEPYAEYVKDNPRISNLAIAVIATKLTEPLRIAACLAVVPKVSRWRGIKVDDEHSDIIEEVSGNNIGGSSNNDSSSSSSNKSSSK